MNWAGTHWRTSPYARAEYISDATSVEVGLWNDVYATQAPAAEALVYVNGVQHASLKPTALGPSLHTVSLPTGRKRVTIALPGGLGTPVQRPSAVGLSTWLSSVKFNGPSQAVPNRKHGTLFVGDSILNGSKLTSPAAQAYIRQLQMQMGNEFPLSALGRGGMALYDMTTAVGTQENFGIKKLVREILLHEPMNVVWVLGYNDWYRRLHGSAAAFQAALTAVQQELFTEAPHVSQTSTGLLTTNVAPYNDFASWRDAAYNAQSGVVGLAQLRVDLRSAITSSDISSDGIHPAAGGHTKIANALRPYISDTGEAPQCRIVSNGLTQSATASSRRITFTGRYLQYSSNGGQQAWLESAASDTQVLAAKLYEVQVNNGQWIRLNGGTTAQVVAQASDLAQSTNVIRFRRWNGDGSIVKTINANY